MNLAALALCNALTLAEGDERPVIVDRVPLVPGTNLRYADDALRLIPFAAAGGGAGDDPRGGGDGNEVWGMAWLGGEARWQAGERDEATANLDLRGRLHSETEPTQDWMGRIGLGHRHEFRNGSLEARARISREDGFVPVIGGTSQLDQADARVTGIYLAPTYGAVLRADAARQLYDGSGEDRDRWIANAEFRPFSRTNQGRIGARFRAETTQYDDQTRYTDSDGLTAMANISWKLGAKSNVSADAGVAHRQYEQGVGDLTVTKPAFSVAANWEFVSGSTASISAGQTLDDNSAGNAEVLSTATLAVRTQLARQWQLAASVQGALGRDTGQPTGEIVEERSELEAKLGIEYHFADRSTAIRTEVSGEDNHATFAGDQQGVRLEVAILTAW